MEKIIKNAQKLPLISNIIKYIKPNEDSFTIEELSYIIVNAQKCFNYSHILSSGNTFGRAVISRAAGLAGASPIIDISKIINNREYERFMFAGNIVSRVKSNQDTDFLTISNTQFDPTKETGSKKPILIKIISDVSIKSIKKAEITKIVSTNLANKVSLENAKIVISGGRGAKNKEGFNKIFALADKIANCAVGATRAIVDQGICDNSHQVGQTGKSVSPDLYIALGFQELFSILQVLKTLKLLFQSMLIKKPQYLRSLTIVLMEIYSNLLKS